MKKFISISQLPHEGQKEFYQELSQSRTLQQNFQFLVFPDTSSPCLILMLMKLNIFYKEIRKMQNLETFPNQKIFQKELCSCNLYPPIFKKIPSKGFIH